MRSIARIIIFLTSLMSPLSAQEKDHPFQAQLAAADDQRVLGFLRADKALLETAFSADLIYSHSTGVVDTKPSLVERLLSGKTKYLNYDYIRREFTFPAENIALMSGIVRIKSDTPNGITDNHLSYLAVWKNEAGGWRFIAWQSCVIPKDTGR